MGRSQSDQLGETNYGDNCRIQARDDGGFNKRKRKNEEHRDSIEIWLIE